MIRFMIAWTRLGIVIWQNQQLWFAYIATLETLQPKKTAQILPFKRQKERSIL